MNQLTRVFLLSALMGVSALFPPPVRVSTQDSERVIEEVSIPAQPAQLIEIKNGRGKVFKRGKIEDNDEWMQGLTVGLKNTSDKAITYAEVTLDFPKVENSMECEEFRLAYSLYFGTSEKPDGTAPLPSKKKVTQSENARSGNQAARFVFAQASFAEPAFIPQEEEGCTGCSVLEDTYWTSCADLGVFGGGPALIAEYKNAEKEKA